MSSPGRIRVFVLAGIRLYRESLAQALASDETVEVVGTGPVNADSSATKAGDAVSAFTCGNLTYNVRSNSADLTVGGRDIGERLKGFIDGLGIWSRAWSPADLALYYNSGSGVAFPFY